MAPPTGCGDEAGSTLFWARPLRPCVAGVLVFQAAVPGAKEPGAPAIRSPSAAPAPSPTLWAADVPPPPGQQPRPAQAPPGREAWAPLPLPPGPASSGHPGPCIPPTTLEPHRSGPHRTGQVGLTQPPGSHRALTVVSRLLTPPGSAHLGDSWRDAHRAGI